MRLQIPPFRARRSSSPSRRLPGAGPLGACLLFLLPVLLATPAAADLLHSPNRLVDPGFESGQLQLPFTGAFRGTATVDSSTALTGSYSLKLSATQANAYTTPWWNERLAAVVPFNGYDQDVLFTGWAKASAPNTRLRLYVFCLDEDFGHQALGSHFERHWVGTDWQPVSVEHSCPQSSSYVGVRLQNEIAGTDSWWDDLSLTVGLPESNLLPGGGFEGGQPHVPFESMTGGSLEIDGDAFIGNHALKLTSSGPSAATAPSSGSRRAAVVPLDGSNADKLFTLSLWAKASIAETPTTFTIRCLDSSYQSIDTGSYTAPVDNDWRPYGVSHGCAQTASYLSLEIGIDGGLRTVWVDEARLSLGEPWVNLMRNPGFEESGLELPFTDAVNGRLSIDDTVSFSGESSLRFESTAADAYTLPWNQFAEAPLLKLESATEVQLETWARADQAGVSMSISIFCWDAGYDPMAHPWKREFFTLGTAWQKLSATHTCPGGGFAGARFDVIDAQRVVWFDEVGFFDLDAFGLATENNGGDLLPSNLEFEGVRGLITNNAFFSGTDIDNVNTMNGNLVVTLPIGQRFQVGPSFDYGLTLVYNSNAWGSAAEVFTPQDSELKGVPRMVSNAGFGWQLSLGVLYRRAGDLGGAPGTWPNRTDSRWLYVAPDGSQIFFAGRESSPGYYYALDGGQARLSENGSTLLLEFADGTSHTFEVDASAACPEAGGCYRPTWMQDSFGNWLDVDYSVADVWRLSDMHGRDVYVEFDSGGAVNGGTSEFGDMLTRVKKVRLPSFDSTDEAEYVFHYTDQTTLRGCPIGANTASAMDMPFLTRVSMPISGYDYELAYRLEGDSSSEGVCSNASGLLKTVTTPSHGVIGYHYNPFWELPSTCEFANDSPEDTSVVRSVGVSRRSLYENVADAPDPNVPGDLGSPDSWQRFKQELSEREQPAKNESTTNCNRHNLSITEVLSSPVDGKHRIERHYHTVTRTENRTPPEGEWRVADYGLPISKADLHRIADPDRPGFLYLSREILSSDDETPDPSEVQRRVYRRYASKIMDSCHIALDEPSCFRDDSQLYGELTYYADRYVHRRYEDYDGLGHFRREIITSDMPSKSDDPTQTTFTNYTKNPASLPIAIDGEITVDLPTPASPWLLNLYDRIEKTLDNRTEYRDFEFDSMTGFLDCTRIWAKTTTPASPQVHDIAVVYTANAAGFPILEEYAGGDVAANLGTGSLCGAGSASKEYRIQHAYDFARRSSSQYVDAGGAAVGPKTLDIDIDALTGFPLRSRDHTKSPTLVTEFSVDKLGRKTAEFRRSGGSTLSTLTLGYHLNTSSAGGWVNYKVQSGGETVDHLQLYFDGLGREKRRLARAQFTTGAEDIDVLQDDWLEQKLFYEEGMLHSVTTLQAEGFISNGYDRRFYEEYDVYGRLLRVTEPSDNDAQGDYLAGETKHSNFFDGAVHRQSTRVAVGNDHVKSETLTDAFGRVHEVKADALQSTCGSGCDYYRFFETRYTSTGYTQTLVGDTGQQARRKWVDGRGFTTKETMPEKTNDVTGADVSYEYDSRGNMTRKLEGGLDIDYLFDGAERLAEVIANGRTYKRFFYDARGQVSEATRFSYFDDASTFGYTSFFGGQAVAEVIETFQYDRLGLVSDRHTWLGLTLGSQTPSASPQIEREVDQSWQRDDVGRLVSMDYGTGWTGFLSSPPARTVDYSYAYRQLDEITSGTQLRIDHDQYPNGLPSRIRYFDGAALDSVDRVDTSLTFRPRFKGVVAEDSAGQPIGETGFYNYDARGNITSVVKPTGSLLYDYDRSSRLTRYRTTDGLGTVTEQIDYAYDPFDNMLFSGEDGTSITVNALTNRLSDVGGESVSYDGRGNMLGYGCAHMSWDPFDEQIAWACYEGSVAPPNTAPEDFYYQAIYIYSASDERVMLFERTGESPGGPDPDFAVDVFMLRDLGGNVVRELREEEYETFTHYRDHIWAGRSLRAVDHDGDLQFAHLDHLGSPRILTGSALDGESYRPFGTQYGDGLGMRIGFTGHELNRNAMSRDHDRDGAGMTYDMRAREYSPGLSRFLSPDPAQDGWNLYSYTRNNPVRYIDPDGLSIWSKGLQVIEVLADQKNRARIVSTFKGRSQKDTMKKVRAELDTLPPYKQKGDNKRVVEVQTEEQRDAIANELSTNGNSRVDTNSRDYPVHANPEEGPYSDVHVQVQGQRRGNTGYRRDSRAGLGAAPAMTVLGDIFAPTLSEIASTGDASIGDLVSAAIWDTTTTLDPIGFSDLIAELSGLND